MFTILKFIDILPQKLTEFICGALFEIDSDISTAGIETILAVINNYQFYCRCYMLDVFKDVFLGQNLKQA